MSTISQQFTALIQDALDRGVTRGEEINFDVAMVAVPGPQGQPQPLLGITFTIQAIALDQSHALMVMVPPSVPKQEDVDGMVRQIVEGLVQTRAMAANQTLAQSNGHGQPGGQTTRSGLILPG